MSTKITSRIDTAMNIIAKEIKGVEMIKLGDTPCDGEIITIEFNNGTKKVINTQNNVIGNSIKAVRNKDCNINLQNGRLTTTLFVGGYVQGTRIQLGALVGLAKDFLNNTVPASYVGLSINHIDRTGNKDVYGFINNKLYNIETTSDSRNSRHWRCIQRIQHLTGRHIGVSANDEEVLKFIEFNDDETLNNELFIRYKKYKDNNGTYYLSSKK